jgi:hypothetical protein
MDFRENRTNHQMATAAGNPKSNAINKRAKDAVWGGAFGGTGILIASVNKSEKPAMTSVIPDQTKVEMRAHRR